MLLPNQSTDIIRPDFATQKPINDDGTNVHTSGMRHRLQKFIGTRTPRSATLSWGPFCYSDNVGWRLCTLDELTVPYDVIP